MAQINGFRGVRQFFYNLDQLVTRQTDELGRNTDYQYDDLHNQTRITDALGGVTSMEGSGQGGQGQVLKYRFLANAGDRGMEKMNRHRSTDGYEAPGRLIADTDELGGRRPDGRGHIFGVLSSLGGLSTTR